jgi:hypothetical protein
MSSNSAELQFNHSGSVGIEQENQEITSFVQGLLKDMVGFEFS